MCNCVVTSAGFCFHLYEAQAAIVRADVGVLANIIVYPTTICWHFNFVGVELIHCSSLVMIICAYLLCRLFISDWWQLTSVSLYLLILLLLASLQVSVRMDRKNRYRLKIIFYDQWHLCTVLLFKLRSYLQMSMLVCGELGLWLVRALKLWSYVVEEKLLSVCLLFVQVLTFLWSQHFEVWVSCHSSGF